VSKNPRDHGFGDAPKVVGVPIVGEKLSEKCPSCGCQTLFGIEVEVDGPSPLLRRPAGPHKIVGRYVGCPACPWASPMMTSAVALGPF
jgi:hypothetical protein